MPQECRQKRKPLVTLAPMAGITDSSFREICRDHGADRVTSEMVSSSHHRAETDALTDPLAFRALSGSDKPTVVQIAGYCPKQMSDYARKLQDQGVTAIDINMGCPAKKVCNRLSGSALLKDIKLVANILEAVVSAVSIPVSLKFRTGWDKEHINAIEVAKLAESTGIRNLVLHGRTRACKFKGMAEYETIKQVVEMVSLPVLANGDIDTPEKARSVLDFTGASGVMVGRGALGKPWIFRDINHYLMTGDKREPPSLESVKAVLFRHLLGLYEIYGSTTGVLMARKHVKWYTAELPGKQAFMLVFNKLTHPSAQLASAQEYFERIINGEVMAA